MAKTSDVGYFIALMALFFMTLVGLSNAGPSPSPSSNSGEPVLIVEGKVYCDTCRVKFETKISEPIKGAKVKLLCKDRDNDDVDFEKETETDQSGVYKFEVAGEHEEDICEVHLISSPRSDCNEIDKGWNAARISLSRDVGVVNKVRNANPIGFMKKEAVKECAEVLKSLGFLKV